MLRHAPIPLIECLPSLLAGHLLRCTIFHNKVEVSVEYRLIFAIFHNHSLLLDIQLVADFMWARRVGASHTIKVEMALMHLIDGVLNLALTVLAFFF